MDLQNITLISFGYFDIQFLKKIAELIKKEFSLKIKINDGHIAISECYNPVRLQYDANQLLIKVDNLYASDTTKIIGLFNVDLFIPIFTYIFGQAYLNGRTGIVSNFRLSNERYGIESDLDIILERFSKEIIHELGHTFGLIHCHIPDCVMRSGTYVEDIDQKSSSFCTNCRRIIDKL